MSHGIFVTGTDTEVGKTFISCALLTALNQQGISTAAMKPIASGSHPTPAGLRNDDAQRLQEAINTKLPYEMINPYAFEPAIAPHIAAAESGVEIEIDKIIARFKTLSPQAAFTLIEGVGGWQVPINATQTTADLAAALQLPVILVVGIRLGCLNHALLSIESIHHSGLTLAGWVANCPDPEASHREANIEALKQRINAPCLGVVPNLAGGSSQAAAEYLDLQTLLATREPNTQS